MLEKSIRNIFRLRKIMSSPCKVDVQELVLHDEIEPTSKEDTICVLSKHPNIPDSLSAGDVTPGLSNPAFVPDITERSNEEKYMGTQSGSPENECQKEAWGITNGQELPICSEMKSPSPNHLDVKPTPFRNEQDAWIESDQGTYISRKFRELRESFSSRAQKIKERIIVQPPTPSPSPAPSESEEHQARPRLQSLIQPYDDQQADDLWLDEMVAICCCHTKRRYIPTFPKVLDPQSKLYISWLLIVTLCYLYNAWAVFVRAAFPYQTPDNLYVFFSFDYFSDITYFIDIFVFKVRVQYLHDGFWVDDPVMTRKNYLRKNMFKMDLLSLLPLDLLYFKYGPNSLFRMPRILKVQTFWEFFNRVDAVAKSPYLIRILRTFIYMMYLIHLNGCAYYAMSSWEGIGSNLWVFDGKGNAYIRCIYFATKTATSIGKNPKPENEYEYSFMTVSWLMGVFIFAFLIGQIRDIVATATQSKTQYRQRMDQTVQYMRNLGLPDDLQRRVRLWLNHTWEQQKTLDEAMILDSLPRKMKTDVAINVHYNTLVKVQLFKDCDKALLRDLVLKLKPVLFLPGDFVCMKGEVGKEMYIVNKGLVQVMGGEDSNLVLATLSEGSVFGEISLLGIQGCNRRTADVRSKGFSNLFVLSKSDLWDALKNYPEAQTLLKKKAKSLIRQNEAFKKLKSSSQISAEAIIKDLSDRVNTPKFVRAVMRVLPGDSTCAQRLRIKPPVTTAEKDESATKMNVETLPQPSQKQPEIQKVTEKTNKIAKKPNSAPPIKKIHKNTESSRTHVGTIPYKKQTKDGPTQLGTKPTKKKIKDSPTQPDTASAKKQKEDAPIQSETIPTKKQIKDSPTQPDTVLAKKPKKDVPTQSGTMPAKKQIQDSPTQSGTIPTKKQIKDSPTQPDTVPAKKQTKGAHTQSDTMLAKETNGTPDQSTTVPANNNNNNNIPKDLNKESNKVDVTVHSNKDPFNHDNEITFTQLSESTFNTETMEENMAIILNEQTKDAPNKVPTIKTNILMQPLNSVPSNLPVEKIVTPKQLITATPEKAHVNVQVIPEQSDNALLSPDDAKEKANSEQPSTAKISYIAPVSTESSPSTETETTGTEESNKVAQDANEFLNSIMQLIPVNRQSLRLNKRPPPQAGNSNVQLSQEMSDKDSDSTTSVLSLSSLFRMSSGDGISESESIATPNELSLRASTSTSSLVGYDNLAFSTQDMNGSRKSSVLSDETSC